jgi:hypothetical protein
MKMVLKSKQGDFKKSLYYSNILLIGTSSIDWVQQNKLYLMMETHSSLQNAVFLIKLGQLIMSRKFILTRTVVHRQPLVLLSVCLLLKALN